MLLGGHKRMKTKRTVLGGIATSLGLTALGLMVSLSATPLLAERGRDGQVNIIYWQAPSIMNPYLSGGLKDVEAASLVLEPLARYNETGELVPWLAEAIPTLDNGGVADNFTSITWTLKEALLWSDGTSVTSEDVAFSWRYCTAEGGGCAQLEAFKGIADIELPDARTVVIRFDGPRPFPYTAFVGAQTPILQRAQFADCLGPHAPTCTQANFAPIGTGPFMVTEFRPNDTVQMLANPNFRDAAKPAFERLLLKGGSDALTAARAVLETGEFDYGWNLQLAPEVLTRMQATGRGQIISAFGTLVERLVLNLTDPSSDLGAARSSLEAPHPFLTDPAVREALSLSLDRALLVEVGYGSTGRVTCNVLAAPPIYASDANEACKTQDIPRARALLDAAGWHDSDGDGIRAKDGTELRILFQTSLNGVRQDFQDLIKLWWSEIGVATDLRAIDASVFFGSDPGNTDTYQKFFADVQMFAGSFDGTDPEAYMGSWRCSQIPSLANQWQGSNISRYCNPDYDALSAELQRTGGIEARAQLARAMNDKLIQEFILLPLVDRGRVSAHANSLGGVILNTWDSELWNAADWFRQNAE